MNLELVNKLRDYVDQHPYEFDMEQFRRTIYYPDADAQIGWQAIGCLAGITVKLANVDMDTIAQLSVDGAAQQAILGSDSGSADLKQKVQALFYTDQWPHDLEERYLAARKSVSAGAKFEQIHTPELLGEYRGLQLETSKLAVELLDRFIAAQQ
jgi:hypothetical protein